MYVRVSMFSSQEHRYPNLNHLLTSLRDDPELSSIPRDKLPKVVQTLFICTGCDYVSYFAGLGKSTFLKVFFQHAEFINTTSIGSLADTCDTTREPGFLSLNRLIGTVYFKKHLASFKYDCPRSLLNSFTSDNPINQHKQWLNCIRSTVWENIEFEDELPPSWEALWRHWLRSCWVSHFWSQASSNSYYTLPLNDNGWKVTEGCLEIDWDDDQNSEQVKENVRLLLRGCGCKKGCNTKRCSCCKAGRKCGPGCRCSHCENVPSSIQVSRTPETETSDEVETEELEDDINIRHQYHTEMVEYEDGAEIASDSEDTEDHPADSDSEDIP